MALEARLTARLTRGQDWQSWPTARPIQYRRVQLFCGDKLLSEADNWYAPSRLMPEMNRQLNETDAPFGRVIKDLDFHQETHSATLLWSPLPDGWEVAPVPASEARPCNKTCDRAHQRVCCRSPA